MCALSFAQLSTWFVLHAIMPVIHPTTTLKERVNGIKTVRSTNYAKVQRHHLRI